jgi:DNA primase
MATARVGDVTITNADKIWWPDDGLTKLDVVNHYARVASRLLPFTVDRPLTIEAARTGCAGGASTRRTLRAPRSSASPPSPSGPRA